MQGEGRGGVVEQAASRAALGSSPSGQLNKIYRLASLIRSDVLLLLGFCLALALALALPLVIVIVVSVTLCFLFVGQNGKTVALRLIFALRTA